MDNIKTFKEKHEAIFKLYNVYLALHKAVDDERALKRDLQQALGMFDALSDQSIFDGDVIDQFETASEQCRSVVSDAGLINALVHAADALFYALSDLAREQQAVLDELDNSFDLLAGDSGFVSQHERVLNLLRISKQALTASQVAELTGINRKSVQTALWSLKKRGDAKAVGDRRWAFRAQEAEGL